VAFWEAELPGTAPSTVSATVADLVELCDFDAPQVIQRVTLRRD
jgi:hypothetical protein